MNIFDVLLNYLYIHVVQFKIRHLIFALLSNDIEDPLNLVLIINNCPYGMLYLTFFRLIATPSITFYNPNRHINPQCKCFVIIKIIKNKARLAGVSMALGVLSA